MNVCWAASWVRAIDWRTSEGRAFAKRAKPARVPRSRGVVALPRRHCATKRPFAAAARQSRRSLGPAQTNAGPPVPFNQTTCETWNLERLRLVKNCTTHRRPWAQRWENGDWTGCAKVRTLPTPRTAACIAFDAVCRIKKWPGEYYTSGDAIRKADKARRTKFQLIDHCSQDLRWQPQQQRVRPAARISGGTATTSRHLLKLKSYIP